MAHQTIKPTQNLTVVLQLLKGFASAIHAAGNRKEYEELAVPAMGHAADLTVALGGRVILSEFPELCGVEQETSKKFQVIAAVAHKEVLMARQ